MSKSLRKRVSRETGTNFPVIKGVNPIKYIHTYVTKTTTNLNNSLSITSIEILSILKLQVRIEDQY